MLNFLDRFLDNITMYRLVLYILIAYLGLAIALSLLGLLSYSPVGILFSSLLLVSVCWIFNKILAYLFSVPSNVESTYITALILALIISPAKNFQDVLFLGFAACLAIASKYLLALKRKHIFNPAAIAVVLTGFFLHRYASWWIGTASMLPFVALGGFLIAKKLQKIQFILFFLFFTTLTTCIFGFSQSTSVTDSIRSLFFDSAVVFFATVMLTEPLTFPSKKWLQYVYAFGVALLIDPRVHIGTFFSTPEFVLVISNIFSYLVSPKQKRILTLVSKKETTDGIGEFTFSTTEPIHFTPGQYMEWTLSHPHTDSRGNRRYFTIASSPTEKYPQLGIRFYPNASSYKNALRNLPIGGKIAAGSLSGEFTLPKDNTKKLVFLAGGIGITPFRSMVKYLIDTKEKRDIILLYINKTKSEIRYEDIFSLAKGNGVKTFYTESETKRVSSEDIKKYIPDFRKRTFYISGSHQFVKNFQQILSEISVSRSQIKIDFFPGLA